MLSIDEIIYYGILFVVGCLALLIISYFRFELRAIGRRIYQACGIRLMWRRFKYKMCACLLRPGQSADDIEQELNEAEARKRIGFEIVHEDQILDR